ncbi:MAG: class I adenylate-forming enzyme family protein [Lachnospiraceae bacterium]|nr:class I adenylate-forming enzyme family protein [Lachnospiraceae bacterium]
MFDGNELWKERLGLNMEERVYCGKTYTTYRDLPDNLYLGMKEMARRYPEKVCITDDDGTKVTFREFLKLTDEFADFMMLEEKVSPGDHVALMMFNCREFCVAFVALIKIGVMVLPLPSKFKQKEVLSLMEKSDCSMVICDRKFAEWLLPLEKKGTKVLVSDGSVQTYGFGKLLASFGTPEEHVACHARPEDPAVLMFTSGTTSMSKGAVLTNFNVMHAIFTYQKLLDITPEDKSIIAVPIYHVTGLIAILGLFLCSGGEVYLHRIFDADRVLRCVRDNRLTFIHGAPTVFSMLLQKKESFPKLPSLRAFACGSSNMPKEKIRALHEWLPQMVFHTVYGLTETSSPATVFPDDAAVSDKIGSSGIPIPGTVFRIVDESGKEKGAGETGEVQLKGSVVIREYYKLSTKALDEEGWLATGDLGYFTEDGYIYLVDRIKDIINRGGEKICSYDVENELYLMEGIEEAAVVGIPDSLYGETAAAMVKCAPGYALEEKEIQEYLKERMAKYKVPTKIMFVEQIPLTPNGKVNKRKIREMLKEKE